MNLLFADLVSEDFARRVAEIAAELSTPAARVDPDWLMAVMHFETGGTFSPKARNPITGATGLIQFMPRTARSLRTSCESLANKTAVQQLEFVRAYFWPYRGRLGTVEDTYMAVLWPAAIGKPNDHVLFSGPNGAAYRANRGLDANRDGNVTKAEAAAHVVRRFQTGR